MNFNENYLWRNKTKLLNLRFSKLHSAKVLLKLEFDTKDQVLFLSIRYLYTETDDKCYNQLGCNIKTILVTMRPMTIMSKFVVTALLTELVVSAYF